MAAILFFVLVQFLWSVGDAVHSGGGGAFSYSDSTGNRYSGTYGLKDGKIFPTSGDRVGFSDTALPGYGNGFDYGYQGDDFYPTFFSNFGNLLQEAFHSNIENQRLAYDAARKAYDLSSNLAGYSGYYPYFATRLPHPSFPDYGGYRQGFRDFHNFPNFEMPNFGNSAFAGSAVGPGFRRQIAAINPANPISPNVNINRISHYSDTPGNGYVSVSSRSFASSSNINGQETSHRGAETVVDDNGKVTQYKVES